MNSEDLTLELQEKVAACSTPEELLALARTEGYELSDAELEQISGGNFNDACPDQNPGEGPGYEW